MSDIRIVKYIPKVTTANTEYREIPEDDKDFIIQQCIKCLARMAEWDRLRDTDSVWVRDQWWHKRTDKLHKGKEGMNSPCAVLGGIVNNMMFKAEPQRDFSAKQMSDLEAIFYPLSVLFPDIHPFRFQIGFE
jgi:hypothetical protein